LFSGGGSGRSADDIPPPTKTKRREKDQQQQQLKKTNAAEEDEGKLRRRLEEHRSAAENPPEEGDGDSVPVDPVPDYLVGMSAKRPKLAMATSSVERPSVKAKKKQPSLSTTTESTTTMATTTNGSAPPSSPILRIEFPSVAEEEARCQSASLRTRPQPSPQHLQAMRDIQKTIRQFTTSSHHSFFAV
jgi:hypothetical protein